MAYMTDVRIGTGSRMFTSSRKWLYEYETQSIDLLTKLSNAIVQLLICQYNAGAQILMLFESHADLLNLDLFEKFSLPFLNMIAKQIKSYIANNNQNDTLIPLVIRLFIFNCHFRLFLQKVDILQLKN